MAVTFPKFTPPPIIGGAATLGGPSRAAPIPEPMFTGGEEASGFLGDLGKAFNIGTEQTKEMTGQFFRGIGSEYLRSMGANEAADKWDWESWNRTLSTGVEIYDIEREMSIPTRMDEVESVGGVLKYGLYNLAKQAPQLVTQFGLTAIASLAGPQAGLGTFLATSYILGAGEVYSSALAQTGDPHFKAALGAGIPIAFLETLPFSKAIRAMGLGRDYGSFLSREVMKPKWKRALSGSMKLGVAEGTTEAFQNIIEQMTVDYVSSRGLDMQEILASEDFRESAAAGASVGFFLGPLAAVGGRRQGLDYTPPPVGEERVLTETEKTTEEARDALRVTDPLEAQSLALGEAGARAELKRRTILRRRAGQDTSRRDPLYAQTGDLTVQDEAQNVVQTTGLEDYGIPVRRPGMVMDPGEAGVLEEADIAPRDKSRAQKDLDGAYDRQTKEVDRLGALYNKARFSPTGEELSVEGNAGLRNIMEDLAIAQIRLRVFAMEAAQHDIDTGGVGRTKDNIRIEEIRAGRPWKINMGPITKIIPEVLYSRVRDAFNRGDISETKRLLNIIEGLRQHAPLMGDKEGGLQTTITGVSRLGVVEESKEKDRQAKELLQKRVSEILADTPQFDKDNKKIKGAKALLVKRLRDAGLFQFLGISPTVGPEKLVAAINSYLGKEQSAKAPEVELQMNSEEFNAIKREINKRLKSLKKAWMLARDKWNDLENQTNEDYINIVSPAELELNLAIMADFEHSFGVDNKSPDGHPEYEDAKRKVSMALEDNPALNERGLEVIAELMAITGQQARGRGETPTGTLGLIQEAADDRLASEKKDKQKQEDRKVVLEQIQTEEDAAILIRDTMELDDGSWRKLAPANVNSKEALEQGQITFKELKSLAVEVGVETADRKIEDIYKDLASVADRRPFTAQELKQLSTLSLARRSEETDKRKSILKKRYQKAFEFLTKEQEVKKWDLLNLLNLGLPGRVSGEKFVGVGREEENRFIADWALADPSKVKPEVLSVGSEIWHMPIKKWTGKKLDQSAAESADFLIKMINGEVSFNKRGIPTEDSKGIKLENHYIDIENRVAKDKHSKRQAKLTKDKKTEFVPRPLKQLIDTKSDEVLAWDPKGRTSTQLKNDIANQIKAAFQEPPQISAIIEKIHDRLAKRDGVEKGKELSKKKKDKLSAEEKKVLSKWQDLRPQYASPDGRYVLEKKKTTVRKAGTWAGQKVTQVVVRSTETQPGILEAYNSDDQLIGIQDFSSDIAILATTELDVIKNKFNIKSGSRVNNWDKGENRTPEQQKELRDSVLNLFSKYGIPLRGYIEIKAKDGKSVTVNIGDLPLSSQQALLNIDGTTAKLLFSDKTENVINGFSSPPKIDKVLKANESGDGIPKSLIPFLRWDKNEKVWKNRKWGIDKQDAKAEEFGAAYAKLTDKQQKEFKSKWEYISPEITLTLKAKTHKGRLWHDVPIEPSIGDPEEREAYRQRQASEVNTQELDIAKTRRRLGGRKGTAAAMQDQTTFARRTEEVRDIASTYATTFEGGKPRGEILYHGGDVNLVLRKGKPFHVGTRKSAQDRMGVARESERARGGPTAVRDERRTVHELVITPKKEYRPEGKMLDERDQSDMTALYLIQNLKSRQKELLKEGYDSVPYINAIEDEGSISYLILDTSIVEVITEDTPIVDMPGEKGIKALAALERYMKNPKKFMAGKVLKGRITNYIPALFEENTEAKKTISKFWSPIDFLLGKDAERPHLLPPTVDQQVNRIDVEGNIQRSAVWEKVSEEVIEFTDNDGTVHLISKDEILFMDERASETILPTPEEMKVNEIVDRIRANLIHGRERVSSFLQRVSDPSLRAVDRVQYLIRPEEIVVGSKVEILEKSSRDEMYKNIDYLYENRSLLRVANEPSEKERTDLSDASRQQIEDLYLSNRPLGGLELLDVESSKWRRLIPPETSDSDLYIVDRIDSTRTLGDSIYLQGISNRSFTREELNPVLFPVSEPSRLIFDGEDVIIDQDLSLSLDSLWTKNYLKEKERFAITRPLSGKGEQPSGFRQANLQSVNVNVGDVVKLRSEAISQSKNFRGKIVYSPSEINEKPAFYLLDKSYEVKPDTVYEVSGKGLFFTLKDINKNKDVIRTHVSRLSPSSLNSKASENEAARMSNDYEGIVKKADHKRPWLFVDIGVSRRRESPRPNLTSNKSKFGGESGDYEINYSPPLMFGMPLPEGIKYRYRIKRVDEDGATDKGEWKIYSFDDEASPSQAMEENWVWMETTDTLTSAEKILNSHVEKEVRVQEGEEAEAIDKVTPIRKWKNEYGVIIQEFKYNQSEERPENPDGYYYSVELPDYYPESDMQNNFYNPDDPESALSEALFVYSKQSFYQNLAPSEWQDKMVADQTGDINETLVDGTLVDATNEDSSYMDPAAYEFAQAQYDATAENGDVDELIANGISLDEDVDHFSIITENETTEGEFPQRLVAKTKEKGLTGEELFDALHLHFGPGIFNTVKIVDHQGQLPPTINTNESVRAVTHNNTVWMVAENIAPDRVVPVALHEIGAHGFRSIMGQKQYMSLLGEIAQLAKSDPGVRQAYNIAKASLLKTHPNANEWLILEETMAYYAESHAPTTNNFWNTLMLYALKGLHRLKIFFTSELKGWQVMYLIRSALHSHVEAMNGNAGQDRVFEANFLDQPLYQTSEIREPAFLDEDADELSRMLPENVVPDWIARYAPIGRGSTRFFKINWVPREAKKGQQLTFPAWMAGRKAGKGKERFWIGIGNELHRSIFNYFAIMDSYEKAIIARGGSISIPSSRTHNAYTNIATEQRKAFRKEYIDPLTKFSSKHNIDTNDLHFFLYAKHAVFENEVKKRQFKDRPSAGIWSTIEQARKDDDRVPSAEGIMNELESRLSKDQMRHLEEAAQLVYNMNDYRLTTMRDNGLITQNEINAWMGLSYLDSRGKRKPASKLRQQWAATWVPLRGDNINVAWDILADKKRPGGFGIKGPESKKRLGRQTPAESTWAWSIQMGMNIIDRVEKNNVDQSLANLILENRELLNDQMMIISDKDIKSTKGRDPETKKPFLGLYKAVQSDPKHKISFKQNGKQWHILVKDERIGRAFNRTNVMQSNWLLGVFSNVNRYFALVNTTLSPEFILTNFSRDYQTALHNILHEAETRKGLSPERATAIAREVTRNAWKATKGLHQYITEDRTDSQWAKDAKQMSEAGGRIDFYGFKNAKDVENKVNKYIKEQNRKGYQKALKVFLDTMQDVNAAVENTMRLSTYVSVRNEFMRNGMTESEAIAEAADVSRNLTVNFTMKGEMTPLFNSLYLFFNAGTAGSIRAMTSYAKSRKVRKLAKGIFAASLANSMALYLLAGDDEDGQNKYAKIPMDQRHRNMFIYVPGSDSFIKIPLAYGFNLPYVFGDTLVAMGMGQINPWEAAVHVATSTMQSFFPMDVANSDRILIQAVKTVSPTIFDPVVDIAANENWSGNPIVPEPFPGGVTEPPAYRAWASTSPVSKFVTDWANRLLGPRGLMPGGEKPRLGTKYEKSYITVPSPALLDYIYGVSLGSLGRFFRNSGNMVVNVWARGKLVPRHEEDLSIEWNKIPIARRFWTDSYLTDKWHINDNYNIYREEVSNSTNFAKGILNEFGSDSSQWKEFKKSNHFDIVRMDPIRKSIHGDITTLYKARAAIKRNRLIKNDVKEEKILAIEKRIMELKRRFITIFNDRLRRGVPERGILGRFKSAA